MGTVKDGAASESSLKLWRMAADAVDYDPATGVMRWKMRINGYKDSARWNTRHAGKECTRTNADGYFALHFGRKGHKDFNVAVHRLAWFIAFGEVPLMEIDHINQNKQDNRITNLRLVTTSENQRNAGRRSHNTSGYCGVYFDPKSGAWDARVRVHGILNYLGRYKNKEEAAIVAREFRLSNGFTEKHGKYDTRKTQDVLPEDQARDVAPEQETGGQDAAEFAG